jgi:hypothetical protein
MLTAILISGEFVLLMTLILHQLRLREIGRQQVKDSESIQHFIEMLDGNRENMMKEIELIHDYLDVRKETEDMIEPSGKIEGSFGHSGNFKITKIHKKIVEKSRLVKNCPKKKS